MSILVIKSSANGANSVSNKLVDQLVARLAATKPGAAVIERDLGTAPVPHVVNGSLGSIGRAPAAEGPDPVRELANALIAEVHAADIIVIGAPMYNFGIASTLKSWFDHVLRAGETFSYTAEGPKGLVAPKPVVVIETRGGAYTGTAWEKFDNQEPHLRGMLGFIGLTDVDFVRVEKQGMGPENAEPQIAAAAAWIAGFDLARAA
jgi:FMN-dependent NADH-azoreductase